MARPYGMIRAIRNRFGPDSLRGVPLDADRPVAYIFVRDVPKEPR
jgi:hypothetical protein